MKLRYLAIALLAFACTSRAQTTYNSTAVHVNIGVATRAMFGFGPASNPFIGATVVFVNCSYGGSGTYTVLTNYATTDQQSSGAISLTCTVMVSKDPDGDSNQYTAVTVTSAQSGTVSGQTVTLTSAAFQSEQVGMHNQNETLGGSASLTVGSASSLLYPCSSKRKDCLHERQSGR